MAKQIARIIIKLGGSVITIKEKPMVPNMMVIERLAKEIKLAEVGSLIIVHGGGSYGHPIAHEYNLKNGYRSIRQLIGFSKTSLAMSSLNNLLVASLIRNYLPVVTVKPSSFIFTRKGRIANLSLNIVERLLSLGFLPVLHGDVVIDEDVGFSIISGDQLLAKLALALKYTSIIICSDVDGLYSEDPKLNLKAKLIEEITLNELSSLIIGSARNTDVTGGMYGKIVELIPAIKNGVQVKIINAKRPNRLYKALKNEEVKGTDIKTR